MRPVLLEMNGFASFREPARVDFAGADYFALVGPTGAGKSTVIDAMTFALYGSVPRWANRNIVSLGLAPTANRGTVRLVFDVGGARYVVARELRRAPGSGQVSMKTCRLERLADPTALGELGDEVDQLAAESLVTPAVAKLLGLDFEHFCKCVVLPQGEFAEFLHARPADRQKILEKLLGLGVYGEIGQQARVEETTQRQRADLLGEQLVGYVGATEAAEQAAATRADELNQLKFRVADDVPRLVAAVHELSIVRQRAERLSGDIDQLHAVVSPPGLSELGERFRAAHVASEEADGAVAVADLAESDAVAARAAAPERGPLEQISRHHAELSTALAELPATESEQRTAERQAAEAAAHAETAADALEAARGRQSLAAADAERAAVELGRLRAEHDALTGLAVPGGLAELADRAALARHALDAAEQELSEAVAAVENARIALEEAPERTSLEQAARDHDGLAAALVAIPVMETRQGQAARSLDAAAVRVESARKHLEHTRDARDTASRADLAAALRPKLVRGDDCPVCAQPVATLPPPLPGADLEAADAALAAAERDLEAARMEHVAAEQAVTDTDRERTGLQTRIGELKAALAGAPASREAVDAELARLAALKAEAAQAGSRLRSARPARDQAAALVREVAAAHSAARQALRAARDPLVALGAPAVEEEDVPAGWQQLASWAAGQAAGRAERLLLAQGRARETAAERVVADQVLADARAAEQSARRRETATGAAAERARTKHELLTSTITRLHRTLADAPSADATAAALAEIDRLDAAVNAARTRVRSARDGQQAAAIDRRKVEAEVSDAGLELAAVRDPLVRFGAPALPAGDLPAAWSTLTGWARQEAAARIGLLTEAQRDLEARQTDLAAASARLSAALSAAGVELPAGVQVAEVAAENVATAHAAAKAEHARIVERRADAARLEAERAKANEAALVAGLLADLLRRDKFPRWLVSSALDTLVIDASASLTELSGGQFELTHDDGEFVIVDHADADSRRPVRTLSGGETFQASLALALALSAQMSALAAAGAARLDSIFLDEGFGTLDGSTLETVADTLEELASQGQRMVGVITHVSALAERVPVRFAVSRNQSTSTIVREGA